MTSQAGRRSSRRRASESGAGSILAIALVGAVLGCLGMLLAVTTGLSVRQALAGAADSAALAGADTAAGLHPGSPCEIAASVLAANGASEAGCAVDGLVVTVRAARTIIGIPVTISATAGPDPRE